MEVDKSTPLDGPPAPPSRQLQRRRFCGRQTYASTRSGNECYFIRKGQIHIATPVLAADSKTDAFFESAIAHPLDVFGVPSALHRNL